ncbi:MAG: VanW family protein [Bacillota bacterium]
MSSRGMKIAILSVVFACLGALAFLGVAVATGPDTILPGVNVLDVDLSGLTREMAEGKLLLLEKEVVQSTPLVVRYGDRAWRLQPAKIGVSVDRDRVLNEAVKVGRRGSVVQRWRQWQQAKKEGVRIPLYISIDQSKLEHELRLITSEITVPPKDAQLKINPDETVEVVPSQEGITADIEKIYQDILEVFKNCDSAPEVELPLVKASPRVTTREVLDMGINGLLAAYTTTFDPSDADRSYNIRVAAGAINGLLISPGDAFSFNDVVGPRSSEAGYKNAKVIINNELVEGTGGGVCQVSTTLYNAVLLANLEVLDRSNHSIPVAYVLPGRDATVAYNYIDFRFKNSTPYYLYLKTFVKSGRLTVKIYGNSGYRRQVIIKTMVVETSPFKELFLQDPGLKAGETRVKRKGSPGMRVTAQRVVLENGSARVEDLPPSIYNTVDQLVLTGPAGRPPGAQSPPAVNANINTVPGQGGTGSGSTGAAGTGNTANPANPGTGEITGGAGVTDNGKIVPPAQKTPSDKKENSP